MAAQAAVVTVEMRHIMVRVPVVAEFMKGKTVLKGSMTAAAAIKA